MSRKISQGIFYARGICRAVPGLLFYICLIGLLPLPAAYAQQSTTDAATQQQIAERIAELSDRDEKVGERAAEALGAIGVPAVPALVQALKDYNWGVRYRGLKVLGQMGPAAAPAVPVLIELLRGNDLSIRCDVVDALRGIGPAAAAAIPALIETIQASDSPYNACVYNEESEARRAVRPRVRAALARIGSPAVPALIQALKNNRGFTDTIRLRTNAAYILGEIGPSASAAVPALIEALNDETTVQYASVEALGKIDRTAVSTTILTQLLKRRDPLLKIAVLKALRTMGPAATPTTPTLIALLQGTDVYARFLAASALEAIGPTAASAIPALIQTLKDDNGILRTRAASALGEIDQTGKSASALAEALKDNDKYVRSAAADALGRIGVAATPAVPALIKALSNDNTAIRFAILCAISDISTACQDAAPKLPRSGRRFCLKALQKAQKVVDALPIIDTYPRYSDCSKQTQENLRSAVIALQHD